VKASPAIAAEITVSLKYESTMSDKMDEQAAFVPRLELEDIGVLEHGFRPDPDADVYARLVKHVAFDRRGDLEDDPTRKQLIPYCVVTSGSEVFVLRRRTAQTEARLHDKLSFGVGGHINPGDARANDADDIIEGGMLQELGEELFVESDVDPLYVGTLNDDSNEVGRVHLGLVYVCRVPREAVSVRETEKMVGEWYTRDQLEAVQDRLETWSRLLLPHSSLWM
jgi:predicted NUDIX family phosphoesterase